MKNIKHSRPFGRSIVAVSLLLGLSACGGGGSGGSDGNGLLPEAAGCAFLLDAPFNISAAQLNSGGCAYTDENGQTQFWEGTDGNFGPESSNPDTSGDDTDSTSSEDVNPEPTDNTNPEPTDNMNPDPTDNNNQMTMAVSYTHLTLPTTPYV